MFTPDFYLPEHDLYVELTTMKQSLVTPKNRKVRLLRELYPEVNVRLLYRKDYQQLLAKAGYGAVEVQNLRKQDIGDIVISPVELETRVRALARKISRDYRGQSLVLVGVLKGITFFLADLARQIKVPFVIDYLDLKRFASCVCFALPLFVSCCCCVCCTATLPCMLPTALWPHTAAFATRLYMCALLL